MVTTEREGGCPMMESRGSAPPPEGAAVGAPPGGSAGDGAVPPQANGAEPRRAEADEVGPSPAYEGVWRFVAPAVDVSVPQARHAVRDLIRRQGVPIAEDLVQGLLLIVSELVTNAVKHAALLSPELAVEVAIGAEWIRVSVEDSHPYRPIPLETDFAQTGGRGLLLVREIAGEAGGACDVEHTASGGKVIWAAVPLAGRY